jgi:hypothetical protein
MAAGALLFVLGGSLIAASSLTASYGFLNIANSQLDAINIGLKFLFIGVILAPIGAATLAYGIGAGRSPERADEDVSAEPTVSG